MAERIRLILAERQTLGLSYIVLEANSVSPKTMAPPSGICPKFWHSDCRKCCRLSSTDECRQFITLSSQLCVQKDGQL